MTTNDEIGEFFASAAASVTDNELLREPQRAGYEAIRDALAEGKNHVLAQIPVGCGKSGLIAVLPFGVANGRVLVIAPNLQIKDQLTADLDVTNPDGFYHRTGVLADVTDGPWRAELAADANVSDCEDAHIVVTNIHQLAERVDRWADAFDSDFFDLIVVDEAHHNAAPSWQRVFEMFPDARIVSLTATPFRADGQDVEGEVVYTYTFREAMKAGYIKDIRSESVAPQELYFTYHGEQRHHTLDEVLELRDEDWFSKGVALAEECNVSIVDASILWLQDLRSSGMPHQIIAVACSIDHARQIRGLYQERGLEADVIHSNMDVADKDDVMRRLKAGVLDVIVQVQMLGEGFDHPPLSIAAVFRPFRSLSPYIQFVGRVMRVNVQNAPSHVDNRGIVVSHVGLNIERHWRDFKHLDTEDQQLVASWTGSGDSGDGPPTWSEQGRLDVQREVLLDRFISDSFLEDDDDIDSVIDNMIAVMREQGVDLDLLGLSRGDLRERFANSKPPSGPDGPRKLPVQPQERRKVLRQRLVERVRSEAGRVCSECQQPATGVKIALLGGTGAQNNLAAVIVRLNRAVNTFLEIGNDERGELSIEQCEQALDNLADLANAVRDDLRSELS
jgi:superfamily II DNA or RNA helicase